MNYMGTKSTYLRGQPNIAHISVEEGEDNALVLHMCSFYFDRCEFHMVIHLNWTPIFGSYSLLRKMGPRFDCLKHLQFKFSNTKT